ncbi:MAG: M23 family metallopeptidase [Bacteroidota bacterium]|nr:M23 family metallopeptidase [Bacteroidota bacterium]
MISFSIKKYIIHKPFLFLILLFSSAYTQAQFFPVKHYPKDYFIYPVDARISLAANFGELRPNHYHMGLDCRTNQVVNRPVKAAAGGYVARVTVEPFGYGQAIYINHPNGLTTVYGHLNRFFPALEKYVKEKQYQQEKWNVDLHFPPGLFPVKQGQFIAYSGSTGGSMGPHTHFEIRDTKTDKVLNELLFGLPIPDKVPPTIVRLAMYNREKSTYSQSPEIFSLKKVGGDYTTIESIIPVHANKISFGISANDKQSGSNNPNGIYEAVIYLDNVPLSAFELDSISYAETRYVNAHVDYKTHAAGGPYIEHLSRLPGYPQGVYKDINGDGVIELHDFEIHHVRVVVKDPYGNTSVLNFKIKKESPNEDPDPVANNKAIEFQTGQVNVFENQHLQVYLPPATLYDSVAFSHSEKISDAPDAYSADYSLLSGLIPSQDFFTVRIKADKLVLENLKDKMLIKQSWKGKSEVSKASHNGDWYTAKFNNFGDFELIADDEPPVIRVDFQDGANISSYHTIVVTPTDNNHVIKNFRAELDGKWLMFTNDKGRKYIYYFDGHCPRGTHELKISVQDEAGNKTEKNYHFTR